MGQDGSPAAARLHVTSHALSGTFHRPVMSKGAVDREEAGWVGDAFPIPLPGPADAQTPIARLRAGARPVEESELP